MKIEFVKYEGISGYARVMYNDVKDSDTNRIEVAYSGKDIKALLEYLFSLEERIDKAIELIDLIKPELWNISNTMTYKLIDIKNILKGESNERV